MVQEEATKLSKRARRRATGEEATEAGAEAEVSAEGEATAERDGDEADAEGEGDEEQAGEGQPGAAPNRQARRTAAAQARARRKRERAEATAIGLDAGEMVDDALVRFTDKIGRLAKRHWNAIQWVIGLGIIGWLGYEVVSWRLAAKAAKLSDALFEAVAMDNGRIGDPKEQGQPNANGVIDPTPIFETHVQRLEAAAAAYAKAAELDPGSVVSQFAKLGQGAAQLRLNQPDQALATLGSLGSGDSKSPELRGHALEARALSLEAKGDLAGAIQAFEQMGSVPGFDRRSLYQQARLKHASGDTAAAKALLIKLFEQLGPPPAAKLGGLPDRPDFLRERAVQLAAVIDPLEKEVKIPKAPLGADAVQQMLEQLEKSGVVTPPGP